MKLACNLDNVCLSTKFDLRLKKKTLGQLQFCFVAISKIALVAIKKTLVIQFSCLEIVLKPKKNIVFSSPGYANCKGGVLLFCGCVGVHSQNPMIGVIHVLMA